MENRELLEKAKQANSPEEILALATRMALRRISRKFTNRASCPTMSLTMSRVVAAV